MLANAERSRRLSLALIPLGLLFAGLNAIVAGPVEVALGVGVALLGGCLYAGFLGVSGDHANEGGGQSTRLLHVGYVAGVAVFYLVMAFLATTLRDASLGEIFTVPPVLPAVVVVVGALGLGWWMARKLSAADADELVDVYEFEGVAMLSAIVLLLVAPASSWLFVLAYLGTRVVWLAL